MAISYWLFPNFMLNFYPWGLSANVVTPLAPRRTRIDYWRWIADPSLLERAKTFHAQASGGRPYQSPIPLDQEPPLPDDDG